MRASIARLLSGAGVPGCSVAVVNRSGLMWSDAFGFADLGAGRGAQTQTAYRFYSGTKPVTATAVLQLHERGLFQLEDPVATYLPGIGLPADISIVHLLSHQSGLKDTLSAYLAVTFPPAQAPTTAQALSVYRLAPARRP